MSAAGPSAATTRGIALFHEHYGLDAGNIEALAAAGVLAGGYVVAAQHVGTQLGVAGAVTLVGSAGYLCLLGTHEPAQFVLPRLPAMRAVQSGRLHFQLLIKKS